ncbi:MAG: hypothetical protein OXE76_11905 [Alphaproteobacteria bacterium]|nr:hypothetical protein [Alphaproteobacteria bacterium]
MPFVFESRKLSFRLAKEAFNRHGGGPFPDHPGQMFVTLGKGFFRVASILFALPVAPRIAVEE